MRTEDDQAKLENSSLNILRQISLVVMSIGSLAALLLMLRAGRHQQSRVLLFLFGVWVVAPFLAGIAAILLSRTWNIAKRAPLYMVLLAIALCSLAIYANAAFGHTTVKLGFIFLVTPLASWMAIAVVVVMSGLVFAVWSRRRRAS